MNTEAKKAMAVFGGAAAIVLAVGLGGVAENTFSGAGSAATPSSSVVHSNSAPAGSGQLTGSAGPNVHIGTLTGCISGLDC